jgi:hypothetical protein
MNPRVVALHPQFSVLRPRLWPSATSSSCGTFSTPVTA